jgi:hypothetical protein
MRMRKSEFIVLCEDVKHKTFILRYLRSLGFNDRQIRIRLPRAGRGSGEQWVREGYPEQARAQRRRANHTSASLIAVIDADTLSVEQRKQQLDGALDAAGLAAREGAERIAFVIPRRNIESWVHFAMHRKVDEVTDFKQRYRDPKTCRDAADVAVEVCRSGSNESTAPPSLVAACRELRRVVES